MTNGEYTSNFFHCFVTALLQIPDKFSLKAVLTVILVIAEVLFGTSRDAMGVLLMMLGFDWLTGLWKAVKAKEVNSDKFRAGMLKMLFYVLIIAALHALNRVSVVFDYINLDLFAIPAA